MTLVRDNSASARPVPVAPPVWRAVAGGLLALAVAMGIGRFAFTPILPAMRDAFALPPFVLGTLASANYLGYLVGALAGAAPLFGRAPLTVFRASLVVVVVTTGLMAITTSVPAWIGLRFVSGAASAGVFVFASAIVLRVLMLQGRGVLAGGFFAGVGIGIAASGLVVLLVARLPVKGPEIWRIEWLAVTALAAVLSWPALTWLRLAHEPVPGSQPESRPPAAAPARGSRSRLPLALLGTAYFLEGAGYIVAGTFLVAIVAGSGSAEAATMAWIVAGLAAAPSALLWARLARRWQSMPALSLAFLAQAVGLLLLLLRDAAWVGSAVLFGGTFIGITSLTIEAGRTWVEPGQATRSIAVLTAVFGIGQIVGPLLGAALADETGDFGRSLPPAAGAVLLGSGLVLVAGWVRRAGDEPAGGAGAIHSGTGGEEP